MVVAWSACYEPSEKQQMPTRSEPVPSRPPFVLVANGRVGLDFLAQMGSRGSPPVLVVLNERAKQREAERIREEAEALGVQVREWSPETRERMIEVLRTRANAWIVSIYFGHILDETVLDAVQGRAVNLHASLLPWCRGVHTNVYPFIEHCPAGVTLHVMTRGVDRGGILAQREVPLQPWDTGQTLYQKLEDEGLGLLLESWPNVVLASWPGRPQPVGGSEHKTSELATLDTYLLDGREEARAFFDLLRARTFPPHAGLRVIIDGRVVEATVQLKQIDDE